MLSLLLASLQLLSFLLLVTAAAGVLAIASVPANHGVHILVGVLTVLYKNQKDILAISVTDCYFFLPSDFRNIGPALVDVGTSKSIGLKK
jgi:hypothetical protein